MHPGFLAGGLLAGLPVVLHLVMRQRPQKLELPTLRFIKARQATNRRTLKLRQLLLLLLRMVAIAALALAVCDRAAGAFCSATGLTASTAGRNFFTWAETFPLFAV